MFVLLLRIVAVVETDVGIVKLGIKVAAEEDIWVDLRSITIASTLIYLRQALSSTNLWYNWRL